MATSLETSWAAACQKKIVAPEEIGPVVDAIRKKGLTIGTVNGSFDLLHAGHLHILYQASLQADILFVLLNSDRSIQGYKSPDRPIIPLPYRMQMIAAIEFVNYVTSFEELDPRNILQIIRPDVHTNGAEYRENCIEEPTVTANGGRMHYLEKIPGLSTSEIIQKICG